MTWNGKQNAVVGFDNGILTMGLFDFLLNPNSLDLATSWR